jgi:hypothetical protein
MLGVEGDVAEVLVVVLLFVFVELVELETEAGEGVSVMEARKSNAAACRLAIAMPRVATIRLCECESVLWESVGVLE